MKLRGVNVFWEAIGATVVADARSSGEYFCFVDRVGEAGVDRMDVWVEVLDGADHTAFRADVARRLKEVLGVSVAVAPVGKGELDRDTGTSLTSKVRRLLDRRR